MTEPTEGRRALADLITVWQTWQTRNGLATLERDALDRGDTDVARVFRDLIDAQPSVTDAQAASAQRALAAQVAGREHAGDVEEPVPFALTARGYGATGSGADIAPVDELGLTGGEGPELHSGPTLSADDAAQLLTDDGRSLDAARAAVREYQDGTSERLGTSVHAWGLDGADLDAIRAGITPAAAVVPLPRVSSDVLARPGRTDGEDARREQLSAWHAADTGAAATDQNELVDEERGPA